MEKPTKEVDKEKPVESSVEPRYCGILKVKEKKSQGKKLFQEGHYN